MSERSPEPAFEPPRVEAERIETRELEPERLGAEAGRRPVRRRAAGAGTGEPTSAAALSLLSEPELRNPRYDFVRGDLLTRLQRRHGNRAVQRMLAEHGDRAFGGDVVRRRDDRAGAASGGVERYIGRSRGQGQALSADVRSNMERGLGSDLGGVRVHTDTAAGDAARDLGAQAFTTGRDIYFGHGRYQPESQSGRHLLAHELAHTVQQGAAPPSTKAKLLVGPPDDPQEREAEEVADRLLRDEPAKVAPSPSVAMGTLRRQGEPPAPVGPAPEPEGEAGEGDLEIKLGRSIVLKAADIAGSGSRVVVDMSEKPPTVPGLKLKRFIYRPGTNTGELEADLNVPFVEGEPGGVKISVDAEGKAKFVGRAKLPIKIGALNEPTLDLEVGSDDHLVATLAVTAEDLKPPRLPKLSIEGGGSITLSQGRLSGNVNAKLAYPDLAKGDFNLSFKDGVPEGGGKIDITQEFLAGASAGLKIEEGNLTADVSVPASKIAPPIPGLTVPEGAIQIIMSNGTLSGTITGFRLVYRELGEGTLNGQISRDHITGSGEFMINIPAIEPVKGTLGYKSGKLWGQATVSAKQFPKSLPVKSGSITAGIDEKGDVSFKGEVGVEFASVGRGTLKGAYEGGKLDLGAEVDLKVPGLEPITARVNYVNGELEGEIDIPVSSEKLAGISGNLHVEYRERLWKGESTIGYERDNGKVKGEVMLGLAQTEESDLSVYGGGSVTAQVTDFLAGTLKVDILPAGETKLHGAITVTEPIELFPEKKADKELFNISRNIPLWAILVAVIRVRGGARAGVGPGQLRDITVEGEYTVGAEELPSFEISGELFIPAYAEAYVAFGAGLGLDVVLGSLTGGIEAIGTAGVYGAVSVIPAISYSGGNYSIEGTATMAAAAKLKLGLQAWAEIEALWITVWENTWQLAEWVWDVGPTLALQANMSYTFGRPEPPSFEFKTSDIDAERLIQDAMPKEGPKGSGAREALKNRAEWSGRTKGKGTSADKVPDEAADKAKPAAAPKAPPKPAKKPKPTPGEAVAKGPVKEKGGKRTPELEKTINEAAKKEQEKMGEKVPPAPAPTFPAPTPQELEINWANYLDETSGKRIARSAFDQKMQAGEVFHPELGRWTKLRDDWVIASPALSDREKDGSYFAAKMRGGYYAGSLKSDSSYDPELETPVPEGSQQKPYPIHWPTQFLVSNFESFAVAGGTRIGNSLRKPYTIDTGTTTYTYEFGVASNFQSMMDVKSKLKRQDPGRNPSKAATEWDRWRRIGFAGGAATTSTTIPAPSVHPRAADPSLFRRSKYPDGTSTPNGETYGQIIEQDASFAAYQEMRLKDKEKFRADARAGVFDITMSTDVTAYVDYLKAKTATEQSQRGVSGYEMQHVIPLYLIGSSGDTSANMWPLSVGEHRSGHSILRQQPQLDNWGAPTTNIESTDLINKWFVIRAHGSSL